MHALLQRTIAALLVAGIGLICQSFLPISAVAGSVPDNLEWERVYSSVDTNSQGQDYLSGYYLSPTDDNGFIVCGYMLHGVYRGVLKTTSDGVEQWRQRFGDDTNPMLGFMAYQSSDSTYQFAGYRTVAMSMPLGYLFYASIDSNGDTLSTLFQHNDEGFIAGVPAMHRADDEHLILAASVNIGEGRNQSYLLAKADKNGRKVWEKRFPAPYEGFIEVNNVLTTSDGGYAFVAYSYPPTMTTSTIVVVCTNGEGELRWQKQYELKGEVSADFKQTSDGGFIILANKYETNPRMESIHLVKIDKDGERQWDRYIEKGPMLKGTSIYVHDNGSLFIAGYTTLYKPATTVRDEESIEFYLARATEEGAVEWEANYGSGRADYIHYITGTSDGGIVATGVRDDSLYLAKFSSAIATSVREQQGEASASMRITPNPVQSDAVVYYELPYGGEVELTLLDMLGREIAMLDSGYRPAGMYNRSFEGSSCPPGIYFVRLKTGALVTTKIVFIH